MLLEWSATHNLTGAKTLETIRANIIDSALPLGFIEDFGACFDVGSGAGFPGIPLAILRPQSHFILCEPRQKRAAFLSFVAQKLGLANISVIKQRAESYTPKIAIDLITSRAALPSARLFALTEYIAQGGKTRYLLYKGAQTCDIPRAKLYQHKARIYAYL
ncbi:16S rRNA (guanine(527)-N(7))-methyltransferase RsmG [Helicobacter sp. CLO-3]|nr:16S rRNA (guanine(527)-N(7))-methyltransferase RsmG [Helicobacter sp. CLO-3]OHU81271.1 16S rRNA (guanine(527)-N(7))-methyltransferase RsmG [Helicobacter sp. CLO-3]